MKMKTEFNITFKDSEFYDWHFRLHTTDLKSNQDIQNLIEYYDEVCDRNEPFYSPVSVMDNLCDAEGWYWEDVDLEDVRIDWR